MMNEKEPKEYLIGRPDGNWKAKKWWWKPSVFKDGEETLPLEVFTMEKEDHAFLDDERRYCIVELDEYKYPPHKLGSMIIMTKRQAKEVVKQLHLLME